VLERDLTDAYGVVTVLTPGWATRGVSAYGWIYLDQGERYDPATGLYNFNGRVWSPTLMRFVQVDPLGLAPDNNDYRGEGDNPTNRVDPSGLWSWLGACEGGVVGAVVVFPFCPIGAPAGAVAGFAIGGRESYVKEAHIAIYYNPHETQNATNPIVINKRVILEVQRIFDDFAARTCAPGSSVIIHWIPKSDKQLAAEKDVGEFRRGTVGVRLSMTLDSGSKSYCGATAGYDGNISGNSIKMLQDLVGNGDRDMAVAATIAHEIGLHAVGQTTGHFDDSGYVDSADGALNSTFSPAACERIRRGLFIAPK